MIGFGAGIAAWLALPGPSAWVSFLLIAAAASLAGFAAGGGRLERGIGWFGLAMALGCALLWARSALVAAPRLTSTGVVAVSGSVENVERLAARDVVRIILAPAPGRPRLRISIPEDAVPDLLAAGAEVRLRARLTPPMAKPLPGAHDFARDLWFAQIGGVGRALGTVEVTRPAPPRWSLDGLRTRLDRHIRSRLPPSEGAIATALVSGDQGAVPEVDAEAMRRSGLAHLLSVSGLHIAAVIGAAMFASLRLLALSERLALRFNLIVVSAVLGAVTGVGYTLLTGAQVPTVRSCLGALIVMLGMALGRDALSLRVIAVAALLILLARPEALAGASFQLSFAAVTVIVALHSTRFARTHLGPQEEGWVRRTVRSGAGLFLTGLAVEVGLMPFALYHFHRAGLYGVGANLVAIPLTTFVIMPLEALALLLDPLGLSGPLWKATGVAIRLLLWLAQTTAGASGSVVTVPSIPAWSFALMVGGGLWLCLWTTRWRWLGLLPIAGGALAAAATSPPDLLVTGDGRHLAIVDEAGTPAILRERSGDFIRDLLGESSGFDGELPPLAGATYARCTREACVAQLVRGGRSWRILALRSQQRLPWGTLVAACARADLVVAERSLPRGCAPRLVRLDGPALARSGGVSIRLSPTLRIDSVAEQVGDHPWRL
ncbi:ComEC/Rec2 family competence protein [Sphingomonas ginkgonis]|uniref:ComEC/Rec2 family competence protein n=1 Tax=Sphingomonas ginkgonis TaxID=2315330 RepID=UPI001EF1328B|nr:ComEC/Rec2 family competence protein [Sphingomonas ginkgonis]